MAPRPPSGPRPPDSAAQPGPDELGTYVAERYWPGVTTDILTAALQRVTAAAQDQARLGSTVRHLQSMLVPVEEVVFCLFEASSIEAVERANRTADASFDHVAEAILITPDGTGRGRRFQLLGSVQVGP